MRIFRTKGVTVVDFFSEEKRPLPSECVVFEFSEQEWEQVGQEDASWVTDCAFATEFVQTAKLLRFYIVLSSSNRRWQVFSEVKSSNLSLTTAIGLFSMIRRVPFVLSGVDAFELLSFLFVDLSDAIRRGGNWQFRSERKFQVRGRPEKWCIAVDVPEQMVGLLLGPNGRTIEKVEALTEFIKTKISFRD